MKYALAILPQISGFRSGHGCCSLAGGIELGLDSSADLPERIRDAAALLVAEAQVLDAGAATVALRFESSDHPTASPEGYRLRIEPARLTISASGEAGWFYGLQTLRQLILLHGPGDIPCGAIEDHPRFPWRGSMIDSARHFQPVEWLLRHLDRMAALKLNRFHWHLCDDQAWRPEIQRYPQLVARSAWRGKGEHREGGYYTQDDMRQVVEYARQRYITVIPEIEMPGHCNAALVAFPELSCDKQPLPVADRGWDAFTRLAGRRAFCAAEPRVYAFLEHVLEEICDVFDPPYLHIGGDETPRKSWDGCPHCQMTKERLGCEDSEGLRLHFLRRIHDFCQSRLGKRTIAWTDGVSSELPADQIVHAWFPNEAEAAARLGYHVINSNHEFTYLDYPATAEDAASKPDWMILLPLEKVYGFDPLPPNLEAQEAERILGSEAPLWTEHAPDEAALEHQLMPRLAAFAEALWSPRSTRDFADFLRRFDLHQAHGTFVRGATMPSAVGS